MKVSKVADEHIVSTDILDRKWIDVNIPCKTACPIMTDIPGYISAIMEGDYEKAYRINRNDNVLPGVLGRVCHRPCENVCRHGRDGLGDPVSICFLKRSSSDFGMKPLQPEININGKKICVIGAGPAGLVAANDLALKGYNVTILEQFAEPGGMLRYGLPQFRLPRSVVAKDVKSITDLGVTVQTNSRVFEYEKLEQLKQDYDAVILAAGCTRAKEVDIPGSDSKGFFWGLDYMMAANEDKLSYQIKDVVVIGGGFTAVDCTRMAYRFGAENITLAFRRTKDSMSVGKFEIEAMEAERVKFSYLVTPIAVESENGCVTGLKLIRNSIENDGSLKTIPGSEFVLKADTVVMAIGQREEWDLFGKKGVEADGNFFIAGDFRNGASTVIEAAADGRKIARQVHQKLNGIKGYQDIIKISEATQTGRERNYDFITRQPMDEIPIQERKEKFKEVDTGFSMEKALIEARRCYLCHYNFQIDIGRCIYCLKCIDVMPVDCIMMAKDIRVSKDGNLEYVKTENWDEVQAIAIDNDKCIRCGNCYRACPVGCISLSRYELDVVEKE